MPGEQLLWFTLLALLWLAYFAIHSLLASVALKNWFARRFPGLSPWYRVLFNLIALITLLPQLALAWQLRAAPLWQWQGPYQWLAYALMLLAVAGFFWSGMYYDNGEFIGTKQLRAGGQPAADPGEFRISPPHRFVRHPWYSFGLLLIWCQSMDPARLLSALLITIYLFIGSRLEEQKLVQHYGVVYRRYQQRVPGILPRPWSYLSAAEAKILLHDSATISDNQAG